MATERERMLGGEPYNPRDPSLLAAAHRARALLAEFNGMASTEQASRRQILTTLFGSVGEGVWIESPFFCEYGENIHVGADTFINTNGIFLDAAIIQIGANVLIGPSVQLLTVTHPLTARERVVSQAQRGAGEAPYRTSARPIQVGANAWIGAGTIVLPGVTIGANAAVGAGSLVTRDIPADVLALGQPCRVVRSLTAFSEAMPPNR